MKIYDIKVEYSALNKLIEDSENDFDSETGEFLDNSKEIKELADELKGKRDDLLDFLADKRDEYKMLETGLGDKIKHLQEKKATTKRQQDRVLDTIDFVLEGEKVKSLEHTYFYSKTQSVEIINEEDIPKDYIDFTPKINKGEIKKALKDGVEIKGAVLTEKIGVRIR